MRCNSATIPRRIAVGYVHVRLLSVPATDTTADLRAAGSRRAVIVAASKGVRLTTGARAAAARLTTAASARRTIVASGHMCSGFTARHRAAMGVTRPVVATGGRVATARSAARPVIADSRATVPL
jgi:hypothetical protein